MKGYFWIYMIRNIVTGKFYIGQTKDLYGRLKAHKSMRDKNTIIVKSISKYGWDNHSIEIIYFSEYISRVNSDELEKFYIKKYSSYCKNNKMGMNLTEGGYSGSFSKKSRDKISVNNFDKWKKSIGKENANIVIMDSSGIEIYKFTGASLSGLINILKINNISTLYSIKYAISKKGWCFFGRKYIIGFDDNNPHELYLKHKDKRVKELRLAPMTDRRIMALSNHRKNIQTIPVIDLKTGVYFDTIREFSVLNNINEDCARRRFRSGLINDRYMACYQ